MEKGWKEENRDKTGMERMTNFLLMAIYRLFPLTAETLGLNPLSHFLLFIYPSPPSVANLSLLHNGAIHWCGVV